MIFEACPNASVGQYGCTGWLECHSPKAGPFTCHDALRAAYSSVIGTYAALNSELTESGHSVPWGFLQEKCCLPFSRAARSGLSPHETLGGAASIPAAHTVTFIPTLPSSLRRDFVPG